MSEKKIDIEWDHYEIGIACPPYCELIIANAYGEARMRTQDYPQQPFKNVTIDEFEKFVNELNQMLREAKRHDRKYATDNP